MLINQYVQRLNLQKLRKVGRNYNFRCIPELCGDGKKSKFSTRGWILTNSSGTIYFCHNCGHSQSFHKFLKEYYPSVYEVYLLEWIQEQRSLDINFNPQNKVIEEKKEPVVDVEELKEFKKLIDLPTNHKAIQYFIKRKFPKKWLSYLYYSDNYAKYINSIFPDSFKKYPKYDPRIILIYRNESGKITLTQGRSIGNSNLRYITTKVDPNAKKIFGLDLINKLKKIIITEGVFDGLFFPNFLSVGGADISLEYMSSLAPIDNLIWLFDVEYRNREICDRILKVIKFGFPVILIPEIIKNKYNSKDINGMVINGMAKKELYSLIKENTFQGLDAEIRFKLMKKC